MQIFMIQDLINDNTKFPHMLEGTPLLPWWYRLQGAIIGTRVYMGTSYVYNIHLFHAEDYVTIDEAAIVPHTYEGGEFAIEKIFLGEKSELGRNSLVYYGVHLKKNSKLLPGSVPLPSEKLPKNTVWIGNPAYKHKERMTKVMSKYL